MATRMLIDARHPEETRVAVLKGNRIEEFDFESAEHKQIKGNIYLAKVTRVEPSLQAAFVDFGGNRHGFLAFGEIHPDYYQIPKEDREALIAEEAEAAAEEAALMAEEDDDEDADALDGDDGGEAYADEMAGEGVEEIDTSEKDEVSTFEGGQFGNGDEEAAEEAAAEHDAPAGEPDAAEAEIGEDEGRSRHGRRRGHRQGKRGSGGKARAKQFDEVREKRMALRRRYKIQDVIQRRQVLLVQVVKEERGNKGAALTTYLSLAGRYCVLMPNSSHGGGISRKISVASDRKRLKQIVAELKLPKSMGCIVRTAGLQRNKTEIKRDFDYLARVWDEIREKTLASSAPAVIHSDSDLVKRAIRDIYNKEIEEVVVEGPDGYKAAKEFMKLLMPSHARRVKAYSDPVPLFQRYGAEDQLSAMYDPVVQLKSGGYLVINPTEALVSIDINSGRSTKEHGIEQTALNTNLEAAREIARQLRLRDMAGLLVIDFIDMDFSSNVRKVERAMKDALKHDRARIQVGRISSFGLMEMSRQRLRTGVLEATTRSCPHCDGTGLVRTASSAGLSALRLIEDEAAKGKGDVITLHASTEATIYLLNAKRADLSQIEALYGVTVQVVPEGEQEGAKMRVTSSGARPTSVPKFEPIVELADDDDEDFDEEAEEEDEEREERGEREERSGEPRKKRRRRGGRGRNKHRDHEDAGEPGEARERPVREEGAEAVPREDGEDRPRKRRRRGGRGRKKRYGEGGEQPAGAEAEGKAWTKDSESEPSDLAATELETGEVHVEAALDADFGPVTDFAPIAEEEQPKPKRSRRKKPASDAEAAKPDEPAPEPEPEAAAEVAAAESEAKPKPARGRAKKQAPKPDAVTEPAAYTEPAPEPATADAGDEMPEGGARRGWWQRTFGEEQE